MNARDAAALALWIGLGGCATQPEPNDSIVLLPAFPSLPAARLTPLPIAVGVHYAPEFAHGVVVDRSAPEVTHRPGPASVALFDHVLASAFEGVVRVAAWPPPANDRQQNVALVFVPRIVGVATVRNPPSRTSGGFSGRLIEYAVDVFTTAGDRVDAWTLHARSQRDGAWSPRDDRLYTAAFRDAAAQLLTAIVRRPALRARLPAARQPETAPSGPRAAPPGPIRLAITSLLEPSESGERKTVNDAACLAGALAQSHPEMSVVPVEEIRDALFPWFERSTLMDAAQQMPELMRQAAVRAGIGSAGLDYVALIHTERSSDRNPDALRCDTTLRAPGCSGVRGDALKTRLQVTLWNLRRFTMSARFEVESAGSATIAGLTVPIPGSRQGSASACERAAAAISHLIEAR